MISSETNVKNSHIATTLSSTNVLQARRMWDKDLIKTTKNCFKFVGLELNKILNKKALKHFKNGSNNMTDVVAISLTSAGIKILDADPIFKSEK